MMPSLKSYKTCVPLLIVITCFGTTATGGFLGDWKEKVETWIPNLPEPSQPQPKPTPRTSQAQPSAPTVDNENTPRYDATWVREIQQRLNGLGFNPGLVDGDFGGKTGNAIKRFEQSRHLPVTGLPTPRLMDSLRSESNAAGNQGGSGAGSGGYSGDRWQSGNTGQPTAQYGGKGALPSGEGMVAPAPQGGTIGQSPEGAVSIPGKPTAADTTTAQPPLDTQAMARKFGLRMVLGRPVIADPNASGEGILTKKDEAALSRFFELIRLALNPEAGKPTSPAGTDKASLCLANRFLSDKQKQQVLGPRKFPYGGSVIDWKGAGRNEFEVQRAKQKFEAEFLPQIVADAPRLPLEFVYISPVHLQTYDSKRGAFPISGQGLTLPATACIPSPHTGAGYVPFATELPSAWVLDPQSAEQIVNRIPVDRDFSARDPKRKVFAATFFTLSAAPSAQMKTAYRQRSNLVPLAVKLKSFALYEDPDLERPLHTFKLDTPAPSVLLSGVPANLPPRQSAVLDEETVALLLVRARGDVLDREAWESLAMRHSRNDAEYYAKKVTRVGGGGAQHVTALESYDPEYVPFFPPGRTFTHVQHLTDEQLVIFKQWYLKRAAELPNRFVLRGDLIRDFRSGVISLTLGQGGGQPDTSKVAAELVRLGYAPGQLVRPDLDVRELGINAAARFLAGSGMDRVPVLALSNLLKAYQPSLSSKQLETLYGSSVRDYPVEMDLLIEGVETISIDPHQEALLLHAQPLALRALSLDASATLYEQTYQVAVLKPGQTSAVSLEAVQPAEDTMPFSAEVADLLIARYLPEALDQAAIERMMLARWHYETSFNHSSKEPQWGRFFIEGKPKPNTQQRVELASRFKEWTFKRAQAMSDRITVVFPHVRIREPGPLKLGVGVIRPRELSGLVNTCSSKAAITSINQPALAQSHKNACTFLEDAVKIPGREIYIGTAGGSVENLILNRRAGRVRRNVDLYGTGIGPRWVCSYAMSGQDEYCRAMLKELGSKGELPGGKDELDDVLVTDKEIYVPGNRTDIIARSPSNILVELDVEVTGIRRVQQLPPHPFVTAYKAYDAFLQQAGLNSNGGGRRFDQFDQETVPLFLFDARVNEARVVSQKSRETVAKLELREPSQPDMALLKIVEPERVAAPNEPYGPDVVGLRLGMSFEDADKIIRGHMKVGRVLEADRAWQSKAATGNIDPYTSGRLYESQDGNELIILLDEPPAAPHRVLGLVRRVSFSKGKVSPTAMYRELQKKYGKASGPDPSGPGQLWIQGQAKNDPLSIAFCRPSYNAADMQNIWLDLNTNTGGQTPVVENPADYTARNNASDMQAMQQQLEQMQKLYAEKLQRSRAQQLAIQQQRRRGPTPSLDCRGCDNPSRTAVCLPGLSATFDNQRSTRWDQLVLRLFDYRTYAQQFSESKRLIEKGDGGMTPANTKVDVEL